MSQTPSTIYTLDFHDLGFMLPGLDYLLALRKCYPKLKVTCFLIPLPNQFFSAANVKDFKEDKYKEWAKIINSYSDWLEIGIHGFVHDKGEMDVDYDKAIQLIEASEKMMKRIGLNYKKLFVAPYWIYSWWSLKALRDKGYTVCLDRNHPIQTPKETKTYYYNWSLEEKELPPKDLIKGHGHMYQGGHANALEDCYANILKQIPADANFKFISEC